MFTLDVPTSKVDQFDVLLDNINVTYRVSGKNEDGSITKLSFKKQALLDKATEELKKISQSTIKSLECLLAFKTFS